MKNEIMERVIRLGQTEHSTEKNKKILILLAEDKRPEEIAKELYLTVYTVRYCIQRMLEINGFHGVAGLVAAAIRSNII